MSDKNDVNDSVISFGVEREEGYLIPLIFF